MLTLTRKIGEEIVIGDGLVVLAVVGFRDRDEVRLGITAPREISVHRREVHEAIRREREGGDHA